MAEVVIHHYLNHAYTSVAVLRRGPGEPGGKAWRTEEQCGHRHRTDTAAEACARKTWPDVPVRPDGSAER